MYYRNVWISICTKILLYFCLSFSKLLLKYVTERYKFERRQLWREALDAINTQDYDIDKAAV